ncbi:MAG: hypothetical protein L0216_09975 [Planctomycetales bacterium]|nr:hypothetical protein [Planctomycetales bacterium]
MARYVLTLPQAAALGSPAVARVGGKAAALADLAARGFAVPPGACVVAEALEEALDGRGGLPPDPEAVRRAIEEAPLPPGFGEEVAAAARALGGGPLAVRSSAPDEDAAGRSAAGLHETVLDVPPGAVLPAIRRCWASAVSAPALADRAARGMPAGRPAMAVLVQVQVAPRAAGVLFTADPLTGDRTVVVVEAVPGRGEGLLAGSREPARVVLDRRTGRPRSPDPGLLPPRVLRRLADLARAVEAARGGPQDVEWALVAGRVLLLQSRPITALPPVPSAAPGRFTILSSVNVRETLPGPISALGYDWFVRFAMPALAQSFSGLPERAFRRERPLALFRGRIFFDFGPVLRMRGGARLLRAALLDLDPGHVTVLDRLLRDRPDSPRPALATRGAWESAARAAVALPRVLAVLLRSARDPDPSRTLRREMDALVARFPPDSPRPAAAAAALSEASCRLAILRGMGAVIGGTVLARLAVALASPWLARRAPGDRPLLGAPGATGEAGGTTTHARDQALAALAREIAATPGGRETLVHEPADPAGLPPPAREALGRFLAEHGHRGHGEFDIAVPRWGEDPRFLLAALRPLLGEPPTRPPPAGGREDPTASLPRPVRALVRRLLARAQPGLRLREDTKEICLRALQRIRDLARAAGGALARAGRLDAADDVFWLTFREVAVAEAGLGGDLRGPVASRRAGAEAAGRWPSPEAASSAGAVGDAAPAAAAEGVLRAVPASAGRASGPARVIRDPSEAGRLRSGEILVVPRADSAWTPLYLSASAVVMEVGGVMSHAAVVAREHGLPAVVGARGVSEMVRDGDLLEVDGAAGTVRRADRRPLEAARRAPSYPPLPPEAPPVVFLRDPRPGEWPDRLATALGRERIVRSELPESGPSDLVGAGGAAARALALAATRPDAVRAVVAVAPDFRGSWPGLPVLARALLTSRPPPPGILRRVRVPTLVLAFGRDLVVPPRAAAALARRIPGARLLVLPGRPSAEKATEALADAVLGFLASPCTSS